jgi:hypothetical protein
MTNPIAREPDEVMIEARDALQAMMDAWFDYHDAHSLTQPVTGAAGNAFDRALMARDKLDATLAARTPTKDRETASPASEAFIDAVQSAQTKLDDLRASLNGDAFKGARLSIFATDLEALLSAACRAPTAASPTPRDTLDGNRALPFDREALGRMVRDAWVRWAEAQPSPKASWLIPYDELAEPDKEADRQIGEAVARWTLIGDATSAALNSTQQPTRETDREALLRIAEDMRDAVAGGMSWISEREALEFVERLKRIAEGMKDHE